MNANVSNTTLRAGGGGVVRLARGGPGAADGRRPVRGTEVVEERPATRPAPPRSTSRRTTRSTGARRVDRRVIEKAATFMAKRGAFLNAAIGFTPDGLLLQKAASAGITGGAKAKPIIG